MYRPRFEKEQHKMYKLVSYRRQTVAVLPTSHRSVLTSYRGFIVVCRAPSPDLTPLW